MGVKRFGRPDLGRVLSKTRGKAETVPIYALPDHEVVERMLPGRFDAPVDDAEAVARIRATPGLVPAAIAPDSRSPGEGRIYWVDIGQQPYQDWQHLFTIERLAREGLIRTAFASSLRVLDAEGLIADALTPSGFIFHTSRCGSTLLGKALARLQEHVVVNQGGPLQRGFWAAHTAEFTRPLDGSAATRRRLRTLVHALTRPRLGCERHSFVKFISWNTLYMDFIASAFPGVPSLFLYRDPVEVIASVMKETTAVLMARDLPQACFLTGKSMEQVRQMSDAVYLAHCYNNYFGAVLNSPLKTLKVLNYYDLRPDTFEHILRSAFGFTPARDVVERMCGQFAFHAKDDSDTRSFAGDGARKRASVAGAVRAQVAGITAARFSRLRDAPQAVAGRFGAAGAAGTGLGRGAGQGRQAVKGK